ncbi:hypothetical protein RRG08_016925 [Elysia crispata]|uniref:Uncharacterized protein n=1 Tax=Elysia crispata TaxID=231223 RepID=A0AAE1DLT8_9GAST|nr:hypothetical protein RRG08_016925 [Elysia crispata]
MIYGQTSAWPESELVYLEHCDERPYEIVKIGPITDTPNRHISPVLAAASQAVGGFAESSAKQVHSQYAVRAYEAGGHVGVEQPMGFNRGNEIGGTW